MLVDRSDAQGFNIDVGDSPAASPLPARTYGGAAGQPGAWNAVTSGSDPVALVDLAGAPTGVVLQRPFGNPHQFDHPGTTGGDHDLLDDQLETDEDFWFFSGLSAGDYVVYTYTFRSDQPVLGNYVSVLGSSDPVQYVAGNWPGAFLLGRTHALHRVTVGPSGTLTVNVPPFGFTLPVVGGFQIVPDVPAPGFSFCEPGVGGAIACPCSNAPSGSDRGCDNSSGTGGALLSAHGTASLAADTFLLSTSGESPTATSIVSQGDLAIASVAFGQGVRCVGGNLKRLYTKAAASGHLHAPGIADARISVRSAQLGDAIAAGTQRFYYVYYRDPVVLGGCSPVRTFNVTQAGSATWGP